jgi:hypothetical protein
LSVIRFHDCQHTTATIMLSQWIPPVILAGTTLPARFVCGCSDLLRMLGHSISILLTTYAHYIPTMQDLAAQLMDDILTPIPIELQS